MTPLSLAIETLGGVATPMIPRNTTIPTKKTETFSTAADSQTSVEVHVLQGERPMAAQNRTLGKFHLTGIPPAPRGVPQIEVTFDIDANGILNVTAKDTATGKDQKITITSSSGLSKEEVERMAKEADAHSAEDKAQREAVDAKNQLDSMVYNVEKMLREQGDKISGSERGDVENAIADAKKALESNDKATMDKARDTLTQASHKLAEQMYKAAQPQTPPSSGRGPGARWRRSGQERRRRDRRRVRRRGRQEVSCQLSAVSSGRVEGRRASAGSSWSRATRPRVCVAPPPRRLSSQLGGSGVAPTCRGQDALGTAGETPALLIRVIPMFENNGEDKLQFEVNGQDYFLNFVEDERRWFVLVPTPTGVTSHSCVHRWVELRAHRAFGKRPAQRAELNHKDR